MFGLGKVGKGLKAWRAWGRFDKATKEAWAMKDMGWKAVTGSILMALSALALGVLPMLNVPPEQVESIAKGLALLGGALGVVGVRHAIAKAKK